MHQTYDEGQTQKMGFILTKAWDGILDGCPSRLWEISIEQVEIWQKIGDDGCNTCYSMR